jgi:hypothetical protein
MRRVVWARAVLLGLSVLLVAGCSTSSPAELTGEERTDAFDESVHAPRLFEFVRSAGGSRYEVRGEVEDDYRYAGTVVADGKDQYGEVVLDDRRFVKLAAAPLPVEARADAALAPLVRGDWVADSARAPWEFAARSTSVLGAAPVLEAVRALESGDKAVFLRRAVEGARRYDTGSADYLERNDKFPAHPEDGVRYDAFPAAYQPDLLFRDGIPTDLEARLQAAFLFASFWFKDGRVTRIETFFDVDVKRVAADMRAALDVQASTLGGAAVAGAGGVALAPVPPPPYRETFTFRYPAAAPVVAAPAPAATLALP